MLMHPVEDLKSILRLPMMHKCIYHGIIGDYGALGHPFEDPSGISKASTFRVCIDKGIVD
jgi:hypothetical protein